MSEPEDDKAVQPSVLIRADEIQEQIQQLSGRDLQLWSIGILLILVLTSGLLALVIPNLVWAQRMSPRLSRIIARLGCEAPSRPSVSSNARMRPHSGRDR